MKVRELRWFGLAVALAAIVNQSVQAEGSRPSQRTLNEMGLGGLVVLSDDEALGIRGFGWKGGHGGSSAVAFGNSFATINTPFGTAHSENGYAAEGKKFAFGANHSEAGIEIKISGGHKGKKNGGGKDNRWGGKSDTKWGGGGGNMWGGGGGNMWGGGGNNWGGGGNHDGGGHHGSKPKVISFKLFAGGWSVAKAH